MNMVRASQLFQVLDEKNNSNICLRLPNNNIKMPVWTYNDTCYITTNDKEVIGYKVDLSNKTPEYKLTLFSFTKDMPYIMDLTLCKYGVEKTTKNIVNSVHITD